MQKASILILPFLVACSTPLRNDQARTIINSNPPGATISTHGASKAAPVEWIWKLSGSQPETRIVTATWVSGASASTKINLAPGQERSYTIQRPNVPGLEIDVHWAMRQQQRQDALNAETAQALGDASWELGRAIGAAAGRR
jgi:hypothetical protein